MREDITRGTDGESIRRLYPEVVDNVRRRDPHTKRRAEAVFRNKRTRRSYIPPSDREMGL